MYGENKQFSIFNSVDSFLFAESVEYSLSEAVRHPGLFIAPFRWNLLHIVSLYANHDFIAKMPEYSQFKMPFLVDAFDRTPFHYLIAHKNVNLMTVNILFGYICDYLEDCQLRDPFEFQKVIKSLSSVLSFIFEKIEIRRRLRFLAMVYTESSLPHSTTAPIFGNILSKSALFCDSPVLTQKTRDRIWDDQGTSQVQFRSNYLNLDYNILSYDMKDLVVSLILLLKHGLCIFQKKLFLIQRFFGLTKKIFKSAFFAHAVPCKIIFEPFFFHQRDQGPH